MDLVWVQPPQWAKKGKTNRRAKRAERKSGEGKRVASLANFFSPTSIFFPFPPIRSLVPGNSGPGSHIGRR